MKTSIEPGQFVAAFTMPLPMDALPIINECIARIYGTGETMMSPDGDTFRVVAPADGFGPLKRDRRGLPKSDENAMKSTYMRLRDGKLEFTVEDAQYRVLVITETMRQWFDHVGGINYVELDLQMAGEDSEFVFTLQRKAGQTPHALRQAAEARVAELEAALADAQASLDVAWRRGFSTAHWMELGYGSARDDVPENLTEQLDEWSPYSTDQEEPHHG